MTQPDKKRTVPFRGRDIVLQELLDSQQILLIKITRDLKRRGEDLEGSVLDAAKLLDILESTLPNPEDVEFIEDLIIKRQLDLREVVYLLAGKDEELTAPKKVVRRGRPPKRAAA